jgi:hypothetical protein
LSRFSDVFFVDASTAKTITADLTSIALTKGAGDSEKDALVWLSGQCKEWLLLFNNADDTTLNLRDYFPCCSHGNVLITSRNRDTCLLAVGSQSSHRVSDLEPKEARDLLLEIAKLTKHTKETETLAATIVKVCCYICLE